jgi:hypothetical protein
MRSLTLGRRPTDARDGTYEDAPQREITVSGHNMIPPDIGEETIELELTAEEMLLLSQAADVEELVAPARISAVAARSRKSPWLAPPTPIGISSSSGARRWHQTPFVRMAGTIIAYIALAWWGASQLAGQPRPPVTAAARPAVVVPPPASMTSSAKPTIRVINPFDATEVFEFPAGTSNDEGREKVAQILLQRAHERQSRWEHIKPVVNLRTASLYR